MIIKLTAEEIAYEVTEVDFDRAVQNAGYTARRLLFRKLDRAPSLRTREAAEQTELYVKQFVLFYKDREQKPKKKKLLKLETCEGYALLLQEDK